MNIRLSILLVAVLLIFGGTFLAVRLTSSPEKPPIRPWLYRMDEDSIVHIQVSADGKTVDYDRKPGSPTWYIQGSPDVPVSQKWSGTTLLLSGPMVERALAPTIDNPRAYGLDPPRTTVKVTDRSGLIYEFHLGDPTPDQQGQYARLVQDPALFTVPKVWGEVISKLATEPHYQSAEEKAGKGPG